LKSAAFPQQKTPVGAIQELLNPVIPSPFALPRASGPELLACHSERSEESAFPRFVNRPDNPFVSQAQHAPTAHIAPSYGVLILAFDLREVYTGVASIL